MAYWLCIDGILLIYWWCIGGIMMEYCWHTVRILMDCSLRLSRFHFLWLLFRGYVAKWKSPLVFLEFFFPQPSLFLSLGIEIGYRNSEESSLRYAKLNPTSSHHYYSTSRHLLRSGYFWPHFTESLATLDILHVWFGCAGYSTCLVWMWNVLRKLMYLSMYSSASGAGWGGYETIGRYRLVGGCQDVSEELHVHVLTDNLWDIHLLHHIPSPPYIFPTVIDSNSKSKWIHLP